MKSDIDRNMELEKIDALLVIGPGDHNPAMVYITGGGHITQGSVVKGQGKKPILFHFSMERDEAARTGLETKNIDQYDYPNLLKEANGDAIKAMAERYSRMLRDVGICKGRIALYGHDDIAQNFSIFNELQNKCPEYEFIGYQENDVLRKAMATKDQYEVDRIKRMGSVVTSVIAKVADYLTGMKVNNKVLMHLDDSPVRISDVKRKINLWLAENDAENPEGTIFSIGRDAGIPHSCGIAEDVIELGKTIVFDIFPCEIGGGYYFDMTRTWCLGFVPDEVYRIYEDVSKVFSSMVNSLQLNRKFKDYQMAACKQFEDMGHPTVLNTTNTVNGYVHSLGHGLGLRVHEKPFSSFTASDNDILEVGSVFTLEPGLYYPDKEMGVRLEDTFYVNPQGNFVALAHHPKDILLSIKE